MMATLQRLLNERNRDLLSTLMDREHFSKSQARTFDFITVSHEAGVSEPFARAGIRALLPVVLRELRTQARAPGRVRETLPTNRRGVARGTMRGALDEEPNNP